MAKTVCRFLGVAFLIVGLIGWFAPHLMGMHLTGTHNLIHLVTGAIAAWLGWRGSYRAARTFCLVFGAVYGLLGLVGLFSGPGTHPGGTDEHMLKLIPGELQFGTADSVVHLLAGIVFLTAGFVRPRLSEKAKGFIDKTKERIGV